MKTKLFLVSSLLVLVIVGFVFSNFKFSNAGDNTSILSSPQQNPPPPLQPNR